MRNPLLLVVLSVLVGCTHDPVPDDYKGPTAKVRDSIGELNQTYGYFFCLTEFNGSKVENSFMRSHQFGAFGFQAAQDMTRDVPAREATFTIEGRSGFAMPISAIIAAILGRAYEVSG